MTIDNLRELETEYEYFNQKKEQIEQNLEPTGNPFIDTMSTIGQIVVYGTAFALVSVPISLITNTDPMVVGGSVFVLAVLAPKTVPLIKLQYINQRLSNIKTKQQEIKNKQ